MGRCAMYAFECPPEVSRQRAARTLWGELRSGLRDALPGQAATVLTAGALAVWSASPASAQTYRIGTPLAPAVVAPWNIDAAPDGRGLPPGRGSVAAGKAVYEAQCAACHGAKGEGTIADRLVGGVGTLASDKPVRTVGSFWPYATTLYDFIYRAMPYTAPQSLQPSEVYAVTAYLLHLNGIVPANAVLDARSLPAVHMPNRDGFVADPRPDTGRPAAISPSAPPPTAALRPASAFPLPSVSLSTASPKESR